MKKSVQEKKKDMKVVYMDGDQKRAGERSLVATRHAFSLNERDMDFERCSVEFIMVPILLLLLGCNLVMRMITTQFKPLVGLDTESIEVLLLGLGKSLSFHLLQQREPTTTVVLLHEHDQRNHSWIRELDPSSSGRTIHVHGTFGIVQT